MELEIEISEGREVKKRDVEVPSSSTEDPLYVRESSRTEEGETPNPTTTEIIQVLKAIDICEVYSPKRVTAQAHRYGLESGLAMDLTTGWDFRIDHHKKAAMKYVMEVKPRLLIGSPMCTMFSSLQRLSGWNNEKQRKWGEAREHIQFVISLYMEQIKNGRLFLHEHPAGASSWDLDEIQKLMGKKDVYTVVADQCMYGLTTWSEKGGYPVPAKKPTKFMTNSFPISRELSKRCDRTHEHQPLVGGRAASAARYPDGLCRAICKGLLKDRKERVNKIHMLYGLKRDLPQNMRKHQDDYHDAAEEEWNKMSIKKLIQGEKNSNQSSVSEAIAWDDLTGMSLDAGAVQEARSKEIDYVIKKNVWNKIRRSEALRNNWKIIDTRWIDINKGDDEHPIHRSRLVGKEFNDGEMDGLFAGTPPLEALRFLVHRAATISNKNLGENVVMICDVARAFFEAKAQRNLCVELPNEALAEGETAQDWVGHLQRSLYGTRDAAMNWQEEVAFQMAKWKFTRGRYNPCLYHQRDSGLMVLVHGDDFVCVGSRDAARMFKRQLESRFEIKTQVIGSGEGEQKEGRVLNRIIRVTEDGWEYEADQRHVDILIDELGLRGANGVQTPCEEEKSWEKEDNQKGLDKKDETRYRALAARANYLATDRPDIMYATKEICRCMSSPTRGAWKRLKRLGRYLITYPRSVFQYEWQGEDQEVDGYTDSDWAGCKQTGKSTSGGAIMIGDHFIKGYSRTQKAVTLSSAEAELVAMVKMSCEILGMLGMMKDWNIDGEGVIWGDSSAALAISKRRGAGKMRHINVGMLWIQEKAIEGELQYNKVKGEQNPADLMTKSPNPSKIRTHLQKMSIRTSDDRAEQSLRTQGSGGGERQAER